MVGRLGCALKLRTARSRAAVKPDVQPESNQNDTLLGQRLAPTDPFVHYAVYPCASIKIITEMLNFEKEVINKGNGEYLIKGKMQG